MATSPASFYQPKPIQQKSSFASLPGMQSGANSINSLNPYSATQQKQSYASIPGLGGASANPYTAKPYTVSNAGYTSTYIPITPGGGSNTAGGGATYSDANSSMAGGAAPNPGQSAYAPVSQDQTDQAFMYNLLNNDPTLGGQLNALANQNQQAWSNYLTAAQQAEIAYGGRMTGDTSGYTAGTFTNPYGGTAGTGTIDTSLAQALNDPGVLDAVTQGKPLSALGQVADQYQHANRAATANLVARGMYGSSALGQHLNENLYQDQLANNSALQNFLGQLGSGYGNYMQGFQNMQGSFGTDTSTALSNLTSMINAGVYTLPSVAAARQAAAAAQAAKQQQQQAESPDYSSDWGPSDVDQSTGYPTSVPTITGTVAQGSKPIVISGKTAAPAQKVTVPVGYSGSGWVYPVGKTGTVRKY